MGAKQSVTFMLKCNDIDGNMKIGSQITCMKTGDAYVIQNIVPDYSHHYFERYNYHLRRYDGKCIYSLKSSRNQFLCKFSKNDYQIAVKKKNYDVHAIKNYPNQIFIEINGIFDIGDAVYSRISKKFGVVTDVLDKGRAKIALIYKNFKQPNN